jgi:hypothetical protein
MQEAHTLPRADLIVAASHADLPRTMIYLLIMYLSIQLGLSSYKYIKRVAPELA